MHEAREEAIVAAVHRLLADKGFDAMTVDEVAAEAGMAKASLYRHFSSKEELAGAAMVRVMSRAHDFLRTVSPNLPAVQRLRAVVDWLLRAQLAGEMPSLPSENSSLRSALMVNGAYMGLLVEISEHLGYTLYARACDPVLGFLKASGQYDSARIIEMVLSTCFDGLRQR